MFPGQQPPQQTPTPQPAAAPMPATSGMMPPSQTGTGQPGQGAQPNPQQIAQIQGAIAAQVKKNLTPEEKQTLASALTPDVVQILQKLFGQNSKMLIDALLQAVGSGDDEQAEGGQDDEGQGDDGSMTDTGDQIGGTDGPLPTEDDNANGRVPGSTALNSIRA